MSESKYTPGPWKAVRRPVSTVIIDRHGDGGYVAESCFVEPLGLQVFGPDWEHNRECCGQREGNNFICANARLIAAAPDLLEAIKHVRKIIVDAAETGFNCHDGDWAERLFASQAVTHAAVKKTEAS